MKKTRLPLIATLATIVTLTLTGCTNGELNLPGTQTDLTLDTTVSLSDMPTYNITDLKTALEEDGWILPVEGSVPGVNDHEPEKQLLFTASKQACTITVTTIPGLTSLNTTGESSREMTQTGIVNYVAGQNKLPSTAQSVMVQSNRGNLEILSMPYQVDNFTIDPVTFETRIEGVRNGYYGLRVFNIGVPNPDKDSATNNPIVYPTIYLQYDCLDSQTNETTWKLVLSNVKVNINTD